MKFSIFIVSATIVGGLMNMVVHKVESFSPSLPTRITTPSIVVNNNNWILYYGPEHNSQQEQQDSSVFTSPVLQKLYPALLSYKEKYGHPNIPLGTKEGRSCDTLRRLHIQNKLTENEVSWLDAIGFRFHSLEDVYKYADFDELFQRLVEYEKKYQTGYQIPKKYPLDPELGAWVTGIRRLSKVDNGLDPQHVERLNSINFAWISTRKCGSKFMVKYRELQELLQENSVSEILKADPKTITWIKAQQEAYKRGTLSETRTHYMSDMFGESWLTDY